MPVVKPENQQGGKSRKNVHRYHHPGIADEGDVEKVGRYDVHKIGNDERKRGCIGDKTGGDDERQRSGRCQTQGKKHCQNDWCQDQGGPIVCEDGGNSHPEENNEKEKP